MPKFDIPDFEIFQLNPLGYTYTLLIDEGWTAAQALYMAWKSHPKPIREEAGLPTTQIALFVNVMGYASDNAVSVNGGASIPQMEPRILTIQRESVLSYYRADVLHALATVAAQKSSRQPPGSQVVFRDDRRLYPEIKINYMGR